MDGHFGAIFARTFGVANERDEAKTRNARLDCNHRIVSLLFHHQLGWILTLLSSFTILLFDPHSSCQHQKSYSDRRLQLKMHFRMLRLLISQPMDSIVV